MVEAPVLLETAPFEVRIVWVDPRWSAYPFVRESAFPSQRLTGEPGKDLISDHLVGYAELTPGARAFGCWVGPSRRVVSRRYWFVNIKEFVPMVEGRRFYLINGSWVVGDSPVDGVLPECVRPRVRSVAASDELRARPRVVPPPAPGTEAFRHVICAPDQPIDVRAPETTAAGALDTVVERFW